MDIMIGNLIIDLVIIVINNNNKCDSVVSVIYWFHLVIKHLISPPSTQTCHGSTVLVPLLIPF